MLESELSKIQGFYTLAEMTALGSHNASPNCRKRERILHCSDLFSSDRDQVEYGLSTDHRDACIKFFIESSSDLPSRAWIRFLH